MRALFPSLGRVGDGRNERHQFLGRRPRPDDQAFLAKAEQRAESDPENRTRDAARTLVETPADLGVEPSPATLKNASPLIVPVSIVRTCAESSSSSALPKSSGSPRSRASRCLSRKAPAQE
jgi:hypothetical protein